MTKEQMDIRFALRGNVNGQQFDMNGTGRGDMRNGTCEMHLVASPSFPMGFDPVSCPLICNHPTATYFAQPVACDGGLVNVTDGDYAVEPARRGTVTNARGEVLLDLQVTGRTFVEDGRLVTESTMSGFSHLPRLDRNVTPVRDYILPSRAGEATAIVRYTLMTTDGEELNGLTVVPYRWKSGRGLQSALVRDVEEILVQWNGGNHVSAYQRVTVRAMSGVLAPATSGRS